MMQQQEEIPVTAGIEPGEQRYWIRGPKARLYTLKHRAFWLPQATWDYLVASPVNIAFLDFDVPDLDRVFRIDSTMAQRTLIRVRGPGAEPWIAFPAHQFRLLVAATPTLAAGEPFCVFFGHPKGWGDDEIDEQRDAVEEALPSWEWEGDFNQALLDVVAGRDDWRKQSEREEIKGMGWKRWVASVVRHYHAFVIPVAEDDSYTGVATAQIIEGAARDGKLVLAWDVDDRRLLRVRGVSKGGGDDRRRPYRVLLIDK